jgi:hypothetical protein
MAGGQAQPDVHGHRRGGTHRRSRGAGLANLFYWIDRKNGFGGFWATQILPFGDPVSFAGTSISKPPYTAACGSGTRSGVRRWFDRRVERRSTPFSPSRVRFVRLRSERMLNVRQRRRRRRHAAPDLRLDDTAGRFGACPKGLRRPVVGGACPPISTGDRPAITIRLRRDRPRAVWAERWKG